MPNGCFLLLFIYWGTVTVTLVLKSMSMSDEKPRMMEEPEFSSNFVKPIYLRLPIYAKKFLFAIPLCPMFTDNPSQFADNS